MFPLHQSEIMAAEFTYVYTEALKFVYKLY